MTSVVLHVTQAPIGPPQGSADPDVRPQLAALEATQIALQDLLSRATSLELALLTVPQAPGPWAAAIPRGPRAPAQQQQLQLPDVMSCVRALCSASALPALGGVERLRVWGGGRCLLTPHVAGLWEALPALTHLDLAADADGDGDGLPSAGGAGGPSVGSGALGALLRRPLGTATARGGGSTEATDHTAPLDLATAQALFAALPRTLRHLSASVSMGEYDRMAAWAGVLSSLPPGLTSLRLLGPLCHSPDLAAAVAGWAAGLPRLRRLELALAECCHSHPDLEAQLYEDPDTWTGSCWQGVFPALTQLRALKLSLDSITDGLWGDTRACSQLTSLRLHPTAWSGMCEATGIFTLTALRELALTVTEPRELRELSTLAQLTRLDLEMLGLQLHEGDSSWASSGDSHRGLLHMVASGLSQLRRLRISCRSISIDASELGLLVECCPALSHLQIRAPFRQPDYAAGSADAACLDCLPRSLTLLELTNTHMAPPTTRPSVRLSNLPPNLVALSIEGLELDLVDGHPSDQQDVERSADKTGEPWQGPACTLAVRASKCTLRCSLSRLCGRATRSLDLSGTALHWPVAGLAGARSVSGNGRGDDGLSNLHGRCQLQRLGLWGCGGRLRPFSDGAICELVKHHPRLRELALTASGATRSGLCVLNQLTDLRSLEVAVSGQECAAALGPALEPLSGLTRLEVVLPVLNFAGDCIRDHLARILPHVSLRLRAQQAGD
ncbi:hypothetical protein PLESTM_000013700 [Pleodorina starrii]|nr:hypothetical protein PLESTM_000013700 [Pleodorina starrii]